MFPLIEFSHSLQYHCVHGIYEIYDWFYDVLFIPYLCLTVVLEGMVQSIPLVKICPAENFINYKLPSKWTQYHQKKKRATEERATLLPTALFNDFNGIEWLEGAPQRHITCNIPEVRSKNSALWSPWMCEELSILDQKSFEDVTSESKHI